MNIELIPNTLPPVLECKSGVERVGDALTVIASCSEHDTDRVLLPAAALPEAFFDLSTGFAGEFLQKLVNYRVRTAGLFETEEGYSKSFREFIAEARRGQQFRAFGSREGAVAWLREE